MQTVLIKLSDTYNVCCHGNSCAYRQHTSFKTEYFISNASENTGCAYVGYLSSLCNCMYIKFTETWIFLVILLLASLYYRHMLTQWCLRQNVINNVKWRHVWKRIICTSLNAYIFVICNDDLFKFSVIVHNSYVFFSVNISLLPFIARRSLLSDLGSYAFFKTCG